MAVSETSKVVTESGSITTISVNGGSNPRWSPAGDELFYRRPGACPLCDFRMMAVPVEFEPDFRRSGEPVELFTGPYDRFFDVLPDAGPLFVPGATQFVMLTRQLPEFAELIWVMNWSTEIADRVTAGFEPSERQ